MRVPVLNREQLFLSHEPFVLGRLAQYTKKKKKNMKSIYNIYFRPGVRGGGGRANPHPLLENILFHMLIFFQSSNNSLGFEGRF